MNLSKKIPVIIIVVAAVVSVFGGVNQLLGLFKEINIAGAVVSAIVSVILFFYLPYVLKKENLDADIKERFGMQLRLFSFFCSFLILIMGTAPFAVQYMMARHYSKEGEKNNMSGMFAMSQNNWTKAESLYNRLGFKDKAIGARINMAQAYAELGKTNDAVLILNELEKSSELSLYNQAKLYAVKGTMDVASGNYVSAEINYQRALQTVEENSATEATILLNKAVVLNKKGPYFQNDAIALVRQAAALFMNENDFQGVATSYVNLSVYYQENTSTARAYLDTAEQFAVKDNAVKMEGIIFLNRGYLYRREGNLDEAGKQYELARKKFEETGDVLSQAEVYNKLAYIDIIHSNFAAALQKIEEAKAWLSQASLDKDNINHVQLALFYSTQAGLLEDCGNIMEAEKLFEQAMSEMNQYRSYSDEVDIKINYASFLQRQAKTEKLMPLLKEIENLLYSDLKAVNNQTVLAATNNLAKIYQDKGQLDKAEQLYQRAIEIAVTIKDKYDEAMAKENLAIVLRWKGSGDWFHYLNEALLAYRQLDNKSSELQCLFNIYSNTSDSSRLPEIITLLDHPAIDFNTKTNITLSISVFDLTGKADLLQQHLARLQELIPVLEKNENMMLLGKCHLRLAQTEYALGNKEECEKHFEAIEKGIPLFPYPQNISVHTDYAILNLNLQKYGKGVDWLFRTFSLPNVPILMEEKILRMAGLFWTELNLSEKQKYRDQLRTFRSNCANAALNELIDNFLNSNG